MLVLINTTINQIVFVSLYCNNANNRSIFLLNVNFQLNIFKHLLNIYRVCRQFINQTLKVISHV